MDKHQLLSWAPVVLASAAMVALPVYLIVDWPMLNGAMTLPETHKAANICGDGRMGGREQCDDGNALIMDGCTGCMVEAGFSCVGEPSACRQGGSDLPFVGCGNGVPDAGEQCDDANAATGDGCSSYCFIETGFLCDGVPSVCAQDESSPSSASSSVSSDSSFISSETHSSSLSPDSPFSFVSSPGISSTAPAGSSTARRINARAARAMYGSEGNTAATPPAPAPSGIKPSCGDERILGTETCDDGNVIGGDGCSAACAVETGYSCSGYPSSCRIACGDGVIMGDETCDDGGNNPGDGCAPECRIEAQWRCTGAPSACTLITYCGDSITEGAEACDDGNDIAGDGCSAACTSEQPRTVIE